LDRLVFYAVIHPVGVAEGEKKDYGPFARRSERRVIHRRITALPVHPWCKWERVSALCFRKLPQNDRFYQLCAELEHKIAEVGDPGRRDRQQPACQPLRTVLARLSPRLPRKKNVVNLSA
jgi:hypothetical protein